MIFSHDNYRSYLKAQLADRVSRNPSYSLRAFARQLGIPASHLSAIHHGRRNLSLETAAKVAAVLELRGNESEYFLVLVQLETTSVDRNPDLAQSLGERARALRPLTSGVQARDLSLDAFRAIADWYHLPILEITGLADSRAKRLDPQWVARRLGIKPIEVEAATERLVRLELLERTTDGAYRKTYLHGVFQSPGIHSPLRKFHQTMLAKAQRALEEQKPEARYVGSQTFAVHPEQLPIARQKIEAFRAELVAHFDAGSDKTEVYFLGVQLFNLTGADESQSVEK